MRTIKMSIIGLGGRGSWWLGQLLNMEDVEITAVCDKHEDRMENGRKMCAEKYGHEVYGSTNWRDVTRLDDGAEAIMITTYWNDHLKVAIDAMKHGKYAAFEVGPAQSIQQCWDLVRTYEETGVPAMLMENCCYGREEMTVLNMIKKGLFGEVLHCQGGYEHDLRSVADSFSWD
ncbi:MAG: gfo/Idh/MocA family oxidoreductase, partial [Ruminococcaceae bacterium]|nr:gfo/Idh/MocA family oxidoreductase [Oscillospiraceae bacterium]